MGVGKLIGLNVHKPLTLGWLNNDNSNIMKSHLDSNHYSFLKRKGLTLVQGRGHLGHLLQMNTKPWIPLAGLGSMGKENIGRPQTLKQYGFTFKTQIAYEGKMQEKAALRPNHSLWGYPY